MTALKWSLAVMAAIVVGALIVMAALGMGISQAQSSGARAPAESARRRAA